MSEEAKVHRSAGYLVPCLFKALQMIEALRTTRVGLRVEDFQKMTPYSRSTIYRILRTLIACQYVARDPEGYYRLNDAVIRTVDDKGRMLATRGPDSSSFSADGKNIEFERWGVRFSSDGRRPERASLAGGSDL